MKQNKNKKIRKTRLVFAFLVIIVAVIIMLANFVRASPTNTSLEQTTIQFIYTGKLVPEQEGTIERLSRLNSVALIEFQNEYLDKYGFVNYYIRMRSIQLFGR